MASRSSGPRTVTPSAPNPRATAAGSVSGKRKWPFLLTSALLLLGLIVAGRFWVTTHEESQESAA